MSVEYQIHLPEYLEKCLNRDRPELHCNGQCILMKKIEEKEKKEAKKNLVVYEYSSLYVHKEYPIFTMYQLNEETCKRSFSRYFIDYKFNYHAPLFRPPIS